MTGNPFNEIFDEINNEVIDAEEHFDDFGFRPGSDTDGTSLPIEGPNFDGGFNSGFNGGNPPTPPTFDSDTAIGFDSDTSRPPMPFDGGNFGGFDFGRPPFDSDATIGDGERPDLPTPPTFDSDTAIGFDSDTSRPPMNFDGGNFGGFDFGRPPFDSDATIGDGERPDLPTPPTFDSDTAIGFDSDTSRPPMPFDGGNFGGFDFGRPPFDSDATIGDGERPDLPTPPTFDSDTTINFDSDTSRPPIGFGHHFGGNFGGFDFGRPPFDSDATIGDGERPDLPTPPTFDSDTAIGFDSDTSRPPMPFDGGNFGGFDPRGGFQPQPFDSDTAINFDSDTSQPPANFDRPSFGFERFDHDDADDEDDASRPLFNFEPSRDFFGSNEREPWFMSDDKSESFAFDNYELESILEDKPFSQSIGQLDAPFNVQSLDGRSAQSFMNAAHDRNRRQK